MTLLYNMLAITEVAAKGPARGSFKQLPEDYKSTLKEALMFNGNETNALSYSMPVDHSYFKCPECGYAERRLVRGNISYSPCPKCGHTPLIRV